MRVNISFLEAGGPTPSSADNPAAGSASASTTVATPPPSDLLPLDNSDHKLRRRVQAYADEADMTEQLPLALQCADAQTRFLWLHGTQGLCICKHCSRRCRTWDDLKVHILTRSCSVLFPDTLHHTYDSAATPNRLPLLWRLTDQLLIGVDWDSICRHIKPEICDLKKRCPICDQWMIQSRGIWNHVEAFHPWALPVLQAAYDCMKSDRRSLFLSSPCSCCASSFRGHQAKHAGECPAILLSRFLSLLLSPGLNHGLRIADRGGDPGGSSGTHSFANLGSQRRNLRDYFWPSDSHAATGQCHPVSDQPAFLKLLQQPTVHTDSTGTVTPGDTQQVSAPRDSGLAATQRKGQRTGGLPDTPEDQSGMSNRAKRRQSQFQPKPRRGPQNPSNNSSSSTDTLVQQMAALLLRHEDQFGGLEPEHLLGSLCGNGPSLERSQHSCSGNPVEQRAEGGSQQNQGPSSSHHVPVLRAGVETCSRASGIGSGLQGRGDPPGNPVGERRPPLPPMELADHASGGSHRQVPSYGERSSTDAQRADSAIHCRRDHHQVPPHETHLGGYDGADSHLPSRAGPTGSQDLQVLANPGDAVCQLGSSPRRLLVEERAHDAIPLAARIASALKPQILCCTLELFGSVISPTTAMLMRCFLRCYGAQHNTPVLRHQ